MSLPYFNMYPADFEADTSHLSLEEDGAYNRLLRLMWMSPGCSLPDDNAWIMRRMRVDAATFERVVLPLIVEFMQRKNGRVISARLRIEYEKADETYKKRSEAGKKGGRPKAIDNKQNDAKAGLSRAKAGPKQPEPEPEEERTEAKASDASVDFAKVLFDRGVAFLGKNGTPERQARSVIGKWRKAYQDTDIFDAFAACSKEGITDPVPWITAKLSGKGQQNGKGSRGERFLKSFIAGASVAPRVDIGQDCDPARPLLARR